MSEPAFKEIDYAQPIRQVEVNEIGFLRVGGLYRSKNQGFFTMIVSIKKATFLIWPKGERLKETLKIFVDYLVEEQVWSWSGTPDQLHSWEYCYDKLR